MFTGIIEEIGIIKNLKIGTKSGELFISCKKVLDGTKIGDSISVNGICLTVTNISSDSFAADFMPETFKRTSFSELNVGSQVNLERAVTPTSRLGGHFVSGHVDGLGTISEITNDENATWFRIKVSRDLLKYIAFKGSIAIDGASLTIAYVDDESFKVSLIPHTKNYTTIMSKPVNSILNIECDVLAKYVERLLTFQNEKTIKKDISLDYLKQNGFA